jgi:uncharacterized protein (DUF697 family)
MKNKKDLLDKLDQSLGAKSAAAAQVAPLPSPAFRPPASPAHVGHRAQAQELVNRAVIWSMGAGLIPLPLVDGTAVFAIQLKLARDLARLYLVDDSADKAKAVVAALAGGGLTAGVTGGALGASLVWVPIIGPALAVAASPVSSGVTTLAIGKLFIAHFENRGTFLDVDMAALRSQFHREVSEAGNAFKSAASDFKTALTPEAS